VANNQRVIAIGGELAPRGVGYWDIVQGDPRLEGEGRYDSDLLIADELRKRVLRLRFDSLYGI